MSAPLPLSSCDTPRAGQVWLDERTGVRRTVIKVELPWVAYLNSMGVVVTVTIRAWKFWAAAAKLQNGGQG